MIHFLVMVLLSVLLGAYLSDVFQYALEHQATRAERWARFKHGLPILILIALGSVVAQLLTH